MADLRMPDGLSDDEQVGWLNELGRQLVEETGLLHGTVDLEVPPGEQPAWVMWGITSATKNSCEDRTAPAPSQAPTMVTPHSCAVEGETEQRQR
jgi:hypothetical protein